MELDMTQTESNNGILKYIIHNKPKESVKNVRTDEIYSNIAYDNVDIEKKYRMTVCFDNCEVDISNKWIELVSL